MPDETPKEKRDEADRPLRGVDPRQQQQQEMRQQPELRPAYYPGEPVADRIIRSQIADNPSLPIAIARQQSMLKEGSSAQLITYTDSGVPLAYEPDIVRFLKDDIGVTSVFIEGTRRSEQFWQSIRDRISELQLFESLLRNQNALAVNINVLPDHIFIDFKNEYGNVITSFSSRISSDGKLGSGYVGSTSSRGEIANAFGGEIGFGNDEGGRRYSRRDRPDDELLDDDNFIENFKRLNDQQQQRVFNQISDLMQARTKASPSPHVGATIPPGGQLYAERTIREDSGRKETAPEFIKRVYGEAGWLTGSFTRADLRKIDPKALNALEVSESRKGKKVPLDELNLPTKKQVNDDWLANPPADETPAKRLSRQRLEASRRYHQK